MAKHMIQNITHLRPLLLWGIALIQLRVFNSGSGQLEFYTHIYIKALLWIVIALNMDHDLARVFLMIYSKRFVIFAQVSACRIKRSLTFMLHQLITHQTMRKVKYFLLQFKINYILLLPEELLRKL